MENVCLGSDAPEVAAVRRADFDDFAFLNEERHTYDQTGFELRGFLNVARGVTFDAVGAFDHLKRNRGRQFNRQRFFVDEQHVYLSAGRQVVFGLTEQFGAQLDLVERVGVDKGEGIPIGVAELETAFLGRKNLDCIGRRETLVERFAVAKITHLDLHERAKIARSAVLRLHHQMGLAVEFDDLASADIVGCGHDVKVFGNAKG
jgi:hypothetical protein